jgi:cell division protein FtsB
MTGLDVADAPPPAIRRRRFRLPASRGGLAWLLVLVIIGAFLALQFGRQVYMNWEMGQRAEAIAAQIEDLEAENAELAAELDYLRSDAFVGAEARRLENLGTDGEEILIIPPGAEEPLPEELTAVEAPQPMLQQWLDLFFGGS